MRSHCARVSMFVVGAIALAACREVIVEDRGEVESSSAGPVSGAGGSAAIATSSGAAPTGAGGAGTGGADGIGGGDACASLAWREEPHRVAQLAGYPDDRWVVADGARLQLRGDAVLALHSGRREPLVTGPGPDGAGARGASWWTIAGPWEGRPQLVDGVAEDWFFTPATPWLAATRGVGETLWTIVAQSPDEGAIGGSHSVVAARLRAPDAGSGGGYLPDAVEAVRDLVHWPDGTRDVVLVSGERQLQAWVGGTSAPRPVGLGACGDRQLALDLELVGGEVRLVHADGDGSCGAPTVLRLAAFDGMAATELDALDLGVPIREVQLVVGRERTWVVARTEGTDVLTVLRLDAAFAVDHRAELPLGRDRQVTAATWTTGLVIVDTGGGDGDEPWIRARALDREGGVVAESTPPAWSFRAEGRPAALGSPSDDAVLVSFADRDAAGIVFHGVMRADCVAE